VESDERSPTTLPPPRVGSVRVACNARNVAADFLREVAALVRLCGGLVAPVWRLWGCATVRLWGAQRAACLRS
jgi:hypothetical protein